MNRLLSFVTVMVLAIITSADAQLRITNVEKLPLDTSVEWSSPQFSPSGGLIYFTNSSYDGIWEYSIETKAVRQITSDPQSGYGFTLSPDGKSIAYRRTNIDKRTRERRQEIVKRNLADGTFSIVASGSDVSTPTFSQNNLLYTVGKQTKNLSLQKSSGEIAILGIENTKITLIKGGKKTLLDPFKNGSYIWPSLSPDKRLILAYEMSRGAFICDLQGRVISRLGKRDAPVWTRDGKWIVFMDDKDDGHRILSSDLFCISPDGKKIAQLTSTDGVIEVHPQCSPTANKIVCSTLSGEIYLLTYEEERQ